MLFVAPRSEWTMLDDWGRTPLPYVASDGVTVYPPAYQQVLKGLPAVDYSARDIIYRPRNVRAHRVYGFSPVQQFLISIESDVPGNSAAGSFSEPGKVLYDQPAHALPAPPPTWSNQQLVGLREQKYQPPDWR